MATGSLRDVRRMVVDHETGHWIGRHHAFRVGDDRVAPVMRQRSKGLQCRRPKTGTLASRTRAAAAHG